MPAGTNFSWAVDGSIIAVYLVLTISIGLIVRKFVSNIEDFLVAGRELNLYLGIASLAATEFGIATCMSNAQLGFKYGFAGVTPGIALTVAMLVVGYSGFCISPLRKSGSLTVPELFENKFGKRVRWASGLVIVLGGLLNMGVFLRQAGDFLVYVCDFDAHYLEIVMTVLLAGVALYTILGGMLSVLVTDFIQFVVMSIGLLLVTFLLFGQIGWSGIVEAVEVRQGAAGFNPFVSGVDGKMMYGVPRIIFDVLIAFSAVLTWQTMVSRVLSAKDENTGRRMYMGTSFFFLVRFMIPVLWGIAAAALLNADTVAELISSGKTIYAMPTLIAVAVPVGLLGIVIAAMLAADMSTNSSYMLAWSSVIFNDIISPFRKKAWTTRQGLLVNRSIVVLIGIFLLLYGLWYPLKGDLWTYLQVTGTIYLASMSVLLIAACYWKKANNWGATAAIAVGAIIPISFLLCQQLEATKDVATAIGPYYAGIMAFAGTGLAMIIGTLCKKTFKRQAQEATNG